MKKIISGIAIALTMAGAMVMNAGAINSTLSTSGVKVIDSSDSDSGNTCLKILTETVNGSFSLEPTDIIKATIFGDEGAQFDAVCPAEAIVQNNHAIIAGGVEVTRESVHGDSRVWRVVIIDGEENRHDFGAFEWVNSSLKYAHLFLFFLMYFMYS